ncbi:hypothetical protein AB1L05_09115 [Cytobacillus horneckiae]|uniref:hypothetical protein n=1 Tax=Cytobacillus horneckiae TaxID=549687 RepID=UPI00203FEF38|nr:hypothetical protein [Cytobacillus horneckiae]MCM3180207.1 hypothetical protein [Cytobacillus horneckiae]
MNELIRRENISLGDYGAYRAVCNKCGTHFSLLFNDGRLSKRECCGQVFTLESVRRLDFVVREK